MKGIIVIGLLFFCFWGAAQNEQVFSIRPYATNQLPSQTIYGVNQTKDGYIYLGTDNGLVRYNGISYELIATGTKGKAFNNLVVHEDLLFCLTFSKELLIVSKNGVEVYDEHDFALEKTSGLKIIGDTLFIKNKRGLIGLDVHSMSVLYDLPSTTKTPIMWEVIKDKSNAVKMIHGDFRVNDLESLKQEEFQSNDHVCRLRYATIKNKELVFDMHNNRFYEYSNGQMDFLDWNLSCLTHQKVHRIGVHNEENILISSYNGLFVLNSKGEFLFHVFEGIPVSETFTDAEGNIWVTTLNDGVYLLPDLTTFSLDLTAVLEQKDKVHRTFLGKKEVLFGTHQGWLYRYNLEDYSWGRVKLGEDAEVQSIYTKDDTIYTYCEKLYTLTSDLEMVDSLVITATKAILKFEEGIYCGTSSNLIFRDLNDDTSRFFQGNWFRSLATSLDERLIIGNTDYGYFSFDRQTKKSEFKEGMLNFYSNPDRNLVAYRKGDEIHINDDGEEKKIESDFTPLDFFVANGSFYYYNSTSIQEWSLEEFYVTNDWETGYELYDKPIISCGIIGGNLVVVFEDFIQIKEIKREGELIQPKIEFKEHQPMNAVIQLGYQGSLGLEMDVIPAVADRGSCKVLYRIEELNKDWTELEAGLEGYRLLLERLPSGSYSIQLKAVNKEGIESETVELAINVAYPYWQKLWFIALVILVVVVIGGLSVRLRVAQVRKKNMKELQIKRLEIQSLNAKLEALRSQMNPHFIFNTINTIQAQIMSDHSNDAYDSLNTFAKLIRAALDHSTKNFVPLGEDKKFIENYLQLEALRFNGTLDYTVEVDPSLENINPEIPSLLVQPFVENSVKHGLLHKDVDDRKLSVRYGLGEGEIVIEIRDNGIGRKASAAINQSNKGASHQPYATQAIDQRLRMLNGLENRNVVVKTEDLEEGTQVVITIKLTK